jgi:hypothetical protein
MGESRYSMPRTIAAYSILTLLALSVVGCRSERIAAKKQAEEVKQSIALQSTPQEVIQYLDAKKIQHSTYADNNITAIVRDNSRWAIVKADYGIVFQFDEGDRLSTINIREHLTGP